MTRKQISKTCFDLRVQINSVRSEEQKAIDRIRCKYSKKISAIRKKLVAIQAKCKHLR